MKIIFVAVLLFPILVFSNDLIGADPLLCDTAALNSQSQLFQNQVNVALPKELSQKLSWAKQIITGKSPLSVTSKTSLPPSNDSHDYYSINLYSWPNPNTADGMPWVYLDGKVNPDRLKISDDSDKLSHMSSWVRDLAYAFRITNDETFATSATLFLRTWFITPKTRMNPNLNFAQATPGVNSGWNYGIIEGVDIVDLLDSVRFLQSSKPWTSHDQKRFAKWLTDYSTWLTTSDLGKKEASAPNNHGNWYDVQMASIAEFLGGPENIQKVSQIVSSAEARITAQINVDGSQPLELKRTRPLHYSIYNLNAVLQLAKLGSTIGGVDLANKQLTGGKSLKAALDYLVPCVASDPSKYSNKCLINTKEPVKGKTPSGVSGNGIEPFNPENALRLYLRANALIPSHSYNDIISDLKTQIANANWIDPQTLCLLNLK